MNKKMIVRIIWQQLKRLWCIYVILILSCFFGLWLSEATVEVWQTLAYVLILPLISISLYIGWQTYRKIMRYQSFWGNVTSEQRDYITSIETLSHTIITQQQQHIRDVEQEAHRLIAEWEDYYSVWSHQIKTPLASLQLQADTDNLSKASVKNEVNKIEHYVKMMIYYLKANHLSNDIALTNIEVDKIIKSLLREHAHFFIQNDLTVNLDVRKLQVLSDEKWLRFILEQLLINAVKYTLQGAITIRSSQFQQLEIIDTGIGILPEDLPRVFEKGYTGYNGRTQHKATGLGLYMVKKLADELNIKLIIESTVGKGTSVRLIFPKNHV